MNFSIIPVAEASVETLVKSINKVIVNPIIIFLFALALVYFIYGIAQYFLNPDSEEIRKSSKTRIIYGIIGLFIMTAVFGIENIILNTLQVKNIKITGNGNYEVVDSKSVSTLKDTTKAPDITTVDAPVETNDKNLGLNSEVNLTNNPDLPEPADGLTYTSDPFSKSSPDPKLCWRGTVYATGDTYYKSAENVKLASRNAYLTSVGVKPETMTSYESSYKTNYPILYGEKKYYNKDDRLYYSWQDVRAPIDTAKEEDCGNVLPLPVAQSSKISSLIGAYTSYGTTYRAVDSGVSRILNTARSLAINNALIQIAKQKGLYSITDINYTILEEKYFKPDQATGNYDYFVAIESKK